jgi:hypothetical protein
MPGEILNQFEIKDKYNFCKTISVEFQKNNFGQNFFGRTFENHFSVEFL